MKHTLIDFIRVHRKGSVGWHMKKVTLNINVMGTRLVKRHSCDTGMKSGIQFWYQKGPMCCVVSWSTTVLCLMWPVMCLFCWSLMLMAAGLYFRDCVALRIVHDKVKRGLTGVFDREKQHINILQRAWKVSGQVKMLMLLKVLCMILFINFLLYFDIQVFQFKKNLRYWAWLSGSEVDCTYGWSMCW